MKGAYALVLRIAQDLEVNVGSLGLLSLESGVWVYIGSAMGESSTSLEKRLQRHFSNDKTIFWHIDHVIASGAELLGAVIAESNEKIECEISEALINSPLFQPGPKGFGSSDCRSNCGTHLFQYIGKVPIFEPLWQIISSLGFNTQIKWT